MLRFDIQGNEVCIDRLISPHEHMTTIPSPDIVRLPFMMCHSQTIPVRLFVQNSCVEAFIGEQLALSCRAYDRHFAGTLGLFIQDGSVQFNRIIVKNLCEGGYIL